MTARRGRGMLSPSGFFLNRTARRFTRSRQRSLRSTPARMRRALRWDRPPRANPGPADAPGSSMGPAAPGQPRSCGCAGLFDGTGRPGPTPVLRMRRALRWDRPPRANPGPADAPGSSMGPAAPGQPRSCGCAGLFDGTGRPGPTPVLRMRRALRWDRPPRADPGPADAPGSSMGPAAPGQPRSCGCAGLFDGTGRASSQPRSCGGPQSRPNAFSDKLEMPELAGDESWRTGRGSIRRH